MNSRPLVLVATTAIVAAVALAVHFWPLLATHMGKSSSMSGRTEIYAEVWRSIMKHPVLGYGFGAFWYAGNLNFSVSAWRFVGRISDTPRMGSLNWPCRRDFWGSDSWLR